MAGRRRIVTVAGASVVAPDAPTLTAPTEAADIYNGVAVTLTAAVTAGQVPDRIDFVLDAGEAGETVVATDSASPYSQSWTPSGVSAGAHTLTARFVYGSGSVDSAAVNVVLFEPTVIAGLLGEWLPESMTTSGGKVTGWTNTGPGGATWDLAQGTDANRPTYDATGNRAGGPCASFVAASTTFLLTGAITQNQPRTVLVVGTLATKINNMTLVDGRNGVGANRLFYSTLGDTYCAAGSFFATGAGDPATDTYYAHYAVFNNASSRVGRNATSATGTAGAVNADGLVLGAGSSAGANPWNGKVERAYLWSSAVSATDLGRMLTYLGF